MLRAFVGFAFLFFVGRAYEEFTSGNRQEFDFSIFRESDFVGVGFHVLCFEVGIFFDQFVDGLGGGKHMRVRQGFFGNYDRTSSKNGGGDADHG